MSVGTKTNKKRQSYMVRREGQNKQQMREQPMIKKEKSHNILVNEPWALIRDEHTHKRKRTRNTHTRTRTADHKLKTASSCALLRGAGSDHGPGHYMM